MPSRPISRLIGRDDLLFICCHFMLIFRPTAFCHRTTQDTMDARNIIYKVIKPRRSLASSYSTTGEDSESLLEKKQVFQRRHSWWEISRSSYIWAAHTIFFLFSLSFFLSGLQQRYPTEQQCARQLSAYCKSLRTLSKLI